MTTIRILALCLTLIAGTTFAQKQKAAPAPTKESKGKTTMIIMKTDLGDMEIELWNEVAPKTVDNFVGLAMGTKQWKDPKSGEMVTRPFYDGLKFHRVINDFMIQGGCPKGDGTGDPGYKFEDECFDTGNAAVITGKIPDVATAMRVYEEILLPYLRTTPQPSKDITSILEKCQAQNSAAPLMEQPIEFYTKITGRTEPFRSQGTLKAKVAYGTICMANSGPNTNGSQFFIVTKKEGCDWLDGKHTVFGTVVKGLDVLHAIEKKGNGVGIVSVRVKN